MNAKYVPKVHAKEAEILSEIDHVLLCVVRAYDAAPMLEVASPQLSCVLLSQ